METEALQITEPVLAPGSWASDWGDSALPKLSLGRKDSTPRPTPLPCRVSCRGKKAGPERFGLKCCRLWTDSQV